MPITTAPDSIRVYRNRDLTVRVTIQNTSVGDISGAKLWLTVKSDKTDDDDDAEIYLRNTAAGGGPTEAEIIDGPNRIVAFYFDKEVD